MSIVKVVIPTLNEWRTIVNVSRDMFETKTLCGLMNVDIEYIIVDDTKDESMITIIKNWVGLKYLRGSNNYGQSLITGMLRSGVHDKLIIMDIDHPYNKIPEMIEMLDRYDVVIGCDDVNNKERKITKWLCNNVLGLNLNHPTCGFIGFNSYVTRLIDDRNIHFWYVHSKHDFVHVEFMKRCKNKKLNIGELSFNAENIKHNYSWKRSIKWLYDFCVCLFWNIFGYYS